MKSNENNVSFRRDGYCLNLAASERAPIFAIIDTSKIHQDKRHSHYLRRKESFNTLRF